MALDGALCFWLSWLLYRRLLEAADGSSSRRGRTTVAVLWRLPGLSRAASAVAWVQMKSGLRSVRGRLAVLLPGPMIVLVAVMLIRTPEEAEWLATFSRQGHLIFSVSLIISIYAVQPFTMNQFASDGSGLTQQFLLPISVRDLIRGKAVGGGGVFAAAGLVSAVAAALAVGGGSPLDWCVVALGGMATYAIVTPATAFLSAVFPVAADMSKPGSGGNPHAASMFIGTFLVLAAALPAALVIASGLLAWTSALTRLGLMALWLVVAVGLAWPLLNLVGPVLTARRENILLTLSKS